MFGARLQQCLLLTKWYFTVYRFSLTFCHTEMMLHIKFHTLIPKFHQSTYNKFLCKNKVNTNPPAKELSFNDYETDNWLWNTLKKNQQKVFEKNQLSLLLYILIIKKFKVRSSNTGHRMLCVSYEKRCCVTWTSMFLILHGVPI